MKRTKSSILVAFIAAVCFLNQGVDAQVLSKGTSLVSAAYTYPNLLAEYVQSFVGGSFWGPGNVSYQYAFIDNLAVGLQASYSSGHTAPITIWDNSGVPQVYTAKYTIAAASIKADYYYLKYKKFRLYGGGSIGYGVATPTVTGDANVAIDPIKSVVWFVNALGVRYSLSDRVTAYAEGGAGILGMANFGLSAQLGKTAAPKTPHGDHAAAKK
jgi:hypothetical protein